MSGMRANGPVSSTLDSSREPTIGALATAAARTGLAVAGPYPWPDTPITGVKILARPSPADRPLFRLGPGTTVRGLWITYDQQPMPSDAELRLVRVIHPGDDPGTERGLADASGGFQ